MSQSTPPTGRKPDLPPGKKGTVPPARRVSTVPQTRGPRRRNDRFGLYFILGTSAIIILFGVAYRGLRSVVSQAPAPVIAATATATLPTFLTPPVAPPAQDTPLAGFTPPPTPSPAAPHALQSGAFAPSDPVTSIVTDVAKLREGAHLPPQLPQPRLDISAKSLDLGTLQTTAVVTREIMLANVASRDLIVRQLASDCACLTATADARKMTGGMRTRMIIAYDPSKDTSPFGRVQHVLAVLTTDGQTPRQDVDIFLTRP